jgi:hypothetical protein
LEEILSFTRENIVAELKQGIYEVTFTKVDGTIRTMPCTLKEELLPKVEITEEQKVPRKINADVLRIYVTDINEWRSFRIENVTNLTKIGG